MRAQEQEPTHPSWSQRTPTRSVDPVPLPSRQEPLTQQAILYLQRAVGNTAAARLIEAQQQPRSRGDGGQLVQRSAVPDVLRSPGRPLDDDTRTVMEARLGADFSDVRLHTDTAAQASAAEIGARAYTSGSHVVIGDGGTDRHTLAHELTHVIQQRQGLVAGTDNGSGLSISDPADHFEREAEVNARRALSGRAPTQHDHPPTGSAGHADTPVQRMDTEMTSPISDVATDPALIAGQSSEMEIDQQAQTTSQSSEMNVDQPVQADSSHKTEVATALKNLGRNKWEDLSVVRGQVVATVPSLPRRMLTTVTTGLKSLGPKSKRSAQKGQVATRPSPRPRRLRQIAEEDVMNMYLARQDSSVHSRYIPSPGEEATVWAEVEAIGEHLIHVAEARAAAAGGRLFQTGTVDGTTPKKQAAIHTSTTAGRRGIDLPSLTIPNKDHIRRIDLANPGSTTPDQVTTPGGTALDRVGVYTFTNEGGDESRMNFYSEAADARVPVLTEQAQGTQPAQVGKLTRFSGTQKVAGPISLSKALLARWSGRRAGSQNSAMGGVSASKAAKASGHTGDQDWQWLHLIAYTMGGRDGSEPNEVGNLAAGLAAANGFHLILENLVKKMVFDDSISDVTVTATANMIRDSFHVCSSIDYYLTWNQDGEDRAGTFAINALNPNCVLGSHTEMLCKQYGIKY